jgi:hypothetical protein
MDAAVSELAGDFSEIAARNFGDIMLGKEKPISTLDNGLLSALLCLKARGIRLDGCLGKK